MADDFLPMVDFATKWNKKNRGDKVIKDAFDPSMEVNFIPVGIPSVDDALGGGLPRGRLTVFFGEPSSGKTLVTQYYMAACQRAGGRVLFVDAERTITRAWLEMTGVDTDPNKLLIVHPRSLEQAFDIMIDALETLKPDMIVLDSVPALIPQSHLEAQMEDKDFRGDQPRKIGEGISKMINTGLGNTAVVFINQVRMAMGVTYGSPESLPGGKGLAFYTALRVRVRRGEWITDKSGGGVADDEGGRDAARVGYVVKLRAEKNKVGTPWHEAEFRMMFTGTIDFLTVTVNEAISKNLITVRAGYFRSPLWEGPIHGRDALNTKLAAEPELLEQLKLALQGLVD